MKHFNLPFEEILIKLDLPETTNEIKKFSPTGKVPALIHDGLNIWESVAIMEYLNELYPEKKMYPQNLADRTRARSLVMEMHAGFFNMRKSLSMNVKKRLVNFDLSHAQEDIDRMKAIWTEQLKKSGGPFLFGEFGLVDAMFTPIPCRFQTYGVASDGLVKSYCESILSLPAMKEWYAEALAEDFEAANHI